MSTATTDKVTVEYIDPKSGRTKRKKMRGNFDQISASWNDSKQGRLLGISEGWSS